MIIRKYSTFQKSVQKYREELDRLASNLGIQTQEDWFHIRGSEVRKLSSILSKRFQGSLYNALRTVYPEFTWNPFSFHTVPQRFWKEKKNHRFLMDQIAEQCEIERQEDWYRFTGKDIRNIGGAGLLADHYNNSLATALQSIYPEYEWNPLRFHSVPLAMLQEKRKSNHRKQMDWFGEQLGIELQSDWYSVNGTEIKNLGGESILKYYNSSLFQALRDIYPEYEWQPLQFDSVPRHFIREKKFLTHRSLMDNIASNLGITVQEQWYSVSKSQVKECGGDALLREHYDDSLSSALKHVYPEFDWEFTRQSLPKMIITDKKRRVHRELWNDIGFKLGIQKQEDWYQVKSKQVQLLGGDSVLNRHYNDSLFYSLQCLYPEFEWNPLRSKNPPRNYVAILQPQILKESLDEEVSSDWKSSSAWMALAYSKLFARVAPKMGGRMATLERIYPELNWTHIFSRSQGENVVEEVLRTVSSVEREKKIRGFRFDFYLPDVAVAIEFQGKQHYKPIHRGSIILQQETDARKKQVLAQLGITLIEVPYWWNKDFSSLLATISRKAKNNYLPVYN